jgi:hypothetical protein
MLAGCATPQERAAKAIKRHGPYCEALGLAPGKPAFAGCVQQEVAKVDAAVDAILTRSTLNQMNIRQSQMQFQRN